MGAAPRNNSFRSTSRARLHRNQRGCALSLARTKSVGRIIRGQECHTCDLSLWSRAPLFWRGSNFLSAPTAAAAPSSGASDAGAAAAAACGCSSFPRCQRTDIYEQRETAALSYKHRGVIRVEWNESCACRAPCCITQKARASERHHLFTLHATAPLFVCAAVL